MIMPTSGTSGCRSRRDIGSLAFTMRTKDTKRSRIREVNTRCASIASRTSTLVRITSKGSSTTTVSTLVTTTVVKRKANCTSLACAVDLGGRRCNIKFHGKSSLTMTLGSCFGGDVRSKSVGGYTRACGMRTTLVRGWV